MGNIIQGDALAELKKLPAASFAACVTSPPYNLGWSNPASKAGKGAGRKSRYRGEYEGFADRLEPDEYVAYHRAVLEEVLRLLRLDGLCWYVHRRRSNHLGNYTPALVDQVLAGLPVRAEIIWDKGSPGPGFCAQGKTGGAYYPTPSYESVFLLAASSQALLYRGGGAAGDVWRIGRNRDTAAKGHPAPFPVELPQRCLEMTMAQGAVIDPFGGSGTVAVAAVNKGRDYTLIEQQPDYCLMARRRLRAQASNPPLGGVSWLSG